MCRVLVAVAEGSEEIETVTTLDTLIRAGIKATSAASNTQSLTITGSRGIKIQCDALLDELLDQSYDCIVLPGGQPGANHLRDCPSLIRMLKNQQQRKGWIAAICAAPVVVLQHHQLLSEAHFTCHPSLQPQAQSGLDSDSRVVVDQRHKLITSQGPGCSIEFAVEIIRQLKGDEVAKATASPMVLAPS
ncbi:DJ-1 family glyoxalase III [Dongshaea marina]|uniref:DJ-1 family glyoxalase III n=1 Tax=Dongshaea marina TaxID=2047966 RepID=UPI000D3ECC6F|nr:DJ-1 family glyoxalase III [Dongshaea marina]